MTIQIRTYTINRDAMDQWVAEWNEKIKPLRIKIGFEVPGAWIVKETNQFIWLMRYDGPEPWDKMDQRFHQSDERLAMDPNPARHIARMEHYFIEPV